MPCEIIFLNERLKYRMNLANFRAAETADLRAAQQHIMRAALSFLNRDTAAAIAAAEKLANINSQITSIINHLAQGDKK